MRLMHALLAVMTLACGGCWWFGSDPTPAPVVTNMMLWPTSAKVGLRQSRQLIVTILDQNGVRMDSTTAATIWSSTADSIATVSPDGLVTALAAGTANIVATVGSRSDTVSITVPEPFAVSVTGMVTAAAFDATTMRNECHYVLVATGSGGAPPDDVGTWADSEVEFVYANGTMGTVPISSLEMVDRFGSQSIQSGQSQTTDGVATDPELRFDLIYRLRYTSGEELRSVTVRLDCSLNPRQP